MDLIYMNSNMEDIGVLQNYEMDLAFGKDENNFECQISANSHCCEGGYFLYFEGTEYGGIVDGIAIDTAINEVTYSGRTWQGILNAKVLCPDDGQAYLVVSGEANSVLSSLLSRFSLTDLFEADSADSGITIDNYQMHRYITGYDGIVKMLDSAGAKLKVIFDGSKVVLSAVKKHDYSQNEEFDSDLMDFRIKKNARTVNHLICLGKGELVDRTVVHLYADAVGEISQTQTQFGIDEYTAVYDYSSVESEEELIRSGTEELKSLWGQNEVSADFDADSDVYDVGDIVGAYDNITGLYIYTEIKKKIVTIKNGQVAVSLVADSANISSVSDPDVGEPEIKFTNLVPTSIDTDGSIYNGTGYKDGYRLSGLSGTTPTEKAATGSVLTGYIPIPNNTAVIRIKGVQLTTQDTLHCYLSTYNASKTKQGYTSYDSWTTSATNCYDLSYDENTGVYIIKIDKTAIADEWTRYIRLNAYGSGANMIVTVNEEIT